jgi:DNA-binding response OmpR family regulator/drug/metabolite transporter (DMT)-like permease
MDDCAEQTDIPPVAQSAAPAQFKTARVLVVDDSTSIRMKLTMAVRNLQHQAEAVEDGAKALERMQSGNIDMVLLDIMMPEMDGFEVLARMKADPNLRHIPTIVVSALDEMDDIARAIELGAIDFLPKTFNAVLLAARINACLDKNEQREQELETLEQLRRLTNAAEKLDSDELNPMELEIQDIAMRPDELGKLSLVLLNKSITVYNRRQAQTQQIKTLMGVLLLLLVGACFGLRPALAKLYLADAANPMGVGLYPMALTTFFLSGYVVAKRIPWPCMTLRTIWFCAVCGLFAPLIPHVLIIWVAGEVPSILIAILMSFEAFIVFFVAAVIGMEQMNVRRFFGLSMGVAGVLALLYPQLDTGTGGAGLHWLVLATGIPLCFAFRSVLLAKIGSLDVDPIAAVAIAYGIATGVLFLVVLSFGEFIPVVLPFREFEWAVIVFAGAEALGMVAFVTALRQAGPVFASQKAYTVAVAGIAWSVLLVQESVTSASAAALVLILFGFYFVARKPARAELLKPFANPVRSS